ncbi:MAG: NUDIX domain-containing protein [Acidimicrobiia bacterium]|nr:NUDIX domain-containing protein [Acidimicrobiia bacterium]
MSAPVIGVGAVIVEDGRILLVRRGKAPAEGLWAVPGGRVEPEETIRDAVVREAAEETGLRVEVDDLAWTGRISASGHDYLLFDFHARVVGGTLAAASDAADARWVPLDEVADLPVVGAMHELLEVLR